MPVDIDGNATDSSAQLVGRGERTAVTRGEEIGLAVRTAVPDRPDRVDHPLRRKLESGRRLGITDVTPAEQTARGQQLGARGAVNRAVDTTAPEQRRVRRVHDRVARSRA